MVAIKKGLIVIDVQNGMFQENHIVHNGEGLLKRLSNLLMKARHAKIPVFYIQHNAPVGKLLEFGSIAWEIHSDVKPKNEDVLIQKTTPDSFLNTTLNKELQKRGVEHVFIAGIQTEVCVDTTCRRAYSMGYKVTLISDTHTTWDSKDITAEQMINHHNRVLRWFATVYPSKEIEF